MAYENSYAFVDSCRVNEMHELFVACDCDPHYHTGECEEGSGRCLCRPEYTGIYCDR